MKTPFSLTLHFSTDHRIELTQSEFVHSGDSSPLVCVRGKTKGAYRNAGTFQWSTGVRGVCLLAIKTVLSSYSNDTMHEPCIVGEKDTLAASLDYAISKQPDWLSDMFGLDTIGNCFAKRLFMRTNAERKRPGPVAVAFNAHLLQPDCIHIILDGETVRDKNTLLIIAEQAQRQEKTLKRKKLASDITKLTEASYTCAQPS